MSEDLNDSVIQVYKYGRNEFLAYNMAEYLLQNKADPNVSDDTQTALYYTWNKASLDLLLKYGLIKERFSALLTDSIRAEILKDFGYKVDVLEFVDFTHSPKNIMLRCKLNQKNHQQKMF